MIVKGTRRQLIFNSTLKKGNNFTGKEKKKVSLRWKSEYQVKTKVTYIFMILLSQEMNLLFLIKENNFCHSMVPLLFKSWSLSLLALMVRL